MVQLLCLSRTHNRGGFLNPCVSLLHCPTDQTWVGNIVLLRFLAEWPPNHKYVTVEATIKVSDNFDPNPTVTLVSVMSNEPDVGLGDGDMPNDIVIIDDDTIDLRAERSGTGDGRIYTITYRATDACGNTTEATATVTVPFDQRGKGP